MLDGLATEKEAENPKPGYLRAWGRGPEHPKSGGKEKPQEHP